MRRKIFRWSVLALLLVIGGVAGQGWAQDARYAATLAAIEGSAGSGRADFSFDALGRQLTYTIVYDALPGGATSAYIAGPQLTDVVFVTIPPAPGPIVGTTTLTEPQSGLLKDGKLFVGVKSGANGNIGGWIAPR